MNQKLVIQAAAREAYAKTMTMLEKVFKVGESSLKSQGINFNAQVTLNRFDALLQFSMLQVALHDGYMHIDELKFISSLSHYCDFCDYLNQSGYHDVTWQTIWNTPESELQSVLKRFENNMRELNKDFVITFSAIDSLITEFDFTSELAANIAVILAGVSVADNDLDAHEVRNCLIMFTLADIASIKASLKKSNNNTPTQKTATQKTSLKDFYVKKNK